MATVTSRPSLDPLTSLIDLPPLVNPHVLPNPHVKVGDLNPAAHTLARRVSSDSQAPGRASPASRVSRRTPVPFLLEAFPAPPSHIPGTPTSLTSGSLLNSPSLLATTTGWMGSASAGPAVSTNPVSPLNPNVMSPCSPKSATLTMLSHSNPPPSSPPTGPLPPIPGPSCVTPDLFATHRALQTAVRSASPALSFESQRSLSRTEQRPRLSIEVNNPVRSRARQGSLSSLRNPVHPVGEQSTSIAEESVEAPCPPPLAPQVAPLSPPIFGSVAERRSHDRPRDDSPDILRTSRVVVAPPIRPGDKLDVEDSIANVDMSDLNALKSDNEGDCDEETSRPFPRCPPLFHSSSQSPVDLPISAPVYVHTPRKPSKSSMKSIHVTSHPEDMHPRHGAMSPEITHMLSTTLRPRKRSTPSESRGSTRKRREGLSRQASDTVPMPTHGQLVKTPSTTKVTRAGCEDGGNESDSSLDLHTPLP